MKTPESFPVLAAAALVLLTLLYSAIERNFLRPWRALKRFQAQGIAGYPARPLIGNIPELFAVESARDKDPKLAASTHAVEFFFNGTKEFGKLWTWSFGYMPRVVLVDPALVRTVFISKSSAFEKPETIPFVLTLLGHGLVSSNGEFWAKQRRLINPAFGMLELKKLFEAMVEATQEHMKHLHALASSAPGKPIEMGKEFTELTLKIICMAAFGARFGETDRKNLEAIHSAFDIYFKAFEATVPFVNMNLSYRFLPTGENRKKWRSEAVIRKSMNSIIQARIKGNAAVDSADTAAPRDRIDLLQLMLNSSDMSLQQLMDECLTFLLAGHETTATLMTWTAMLLSQHPEWQEKAREEVLRVKASSPSNGADWTPSFEEVGEMKLLGWIVHESLRMFPPVAATSRQCHVDTSITDSLTVPAGCEVTIPIEVLHYSEEFWGKDVNEFNPARFAGGVANATSQPGAFCPFTLGPRICIGQNFAVIEGKLILAMLLDRFSWTLDKGYKHHPMTILTVKPKFGMPLVLTPRNV